jgi:protein-tyrosine phosphatase
MRTGLVMRVSGALTSSDELDRLDVLGVRVLIDLRGQVEERGDVMRWASDHGVEYWNFPIMLGGHHGRMWEEIQRAIDEERYVDYLRDAYIDIASNFGPQFAGAFERMSEAFPSAFGCAHGKDRTGIMSAYLHVLLGATEEAAIDAYLDQAPTLEQLLPQLERLYGYTTVEEVSDGVRHLMLVRRDSLEYAFDAVRSLGGVEAFLRDHGLSDRAIVALRENLIEYAPVPQER